MTIERVRRKFTSEVRKDAVALATDQSDSTAKAAQTVDTGENNLRRLNKELEQEISEERLKSALSWLG